MSARRRALLLSILLLAAAPSLRGETANRFANPDFDRRMPPWLSADEPAQWVGVDADGCPASGGATWHILGPENPNAIGQCVPAADDVTLYASFRVSPSALGVKADLVIRFYADGFCSDEIAAYGTFPAELGPGWTTISRAQNPGSYGVRSARVVLEGTTSIYFSPPGPQIVVDRAYVGDRDPILLDDFEGGSDCRWVVR